ncbi:MAG TPA: choice-of-anchor Q domain-containing protein [Pyrinomonadaceae bacterium]|nr:choice-of-anchor Q domain-containing protein [Pyrinomonadaceae bacterium]
MPYPAPRPSGESPVKTFHLRTLLRLAVVCAALYLTYGAFAAVVAGADVTAPGDPVVGVTATAGDNSSTLSNEGTSLSEYPPGQSPDKAIDNDATAGSKYLNFAETGSGLIVTALTNGPQTVVSGFRVATAEDAPERDPVTVTLEGTNDPGATETFNSAWTLLYSGPSGLSTDPGRNTFGTQINFTNTTAYRSYRFLVTGVRNAAAANSMQFSELELIGSTKTVIVSGADVTTPNDPHMGVAATPGSNTSTAATQGFSLSQYPPGQTPDKAFDDVVTPPVNKYLNFGETNVGLIITAQTKGPQTVVTGLRLATAEDFPDRDPVTVVLEGTNDEDAWATLNSTWTQIYSGASGLGTDPGRSTFGPQQNFANSTPYRSYRLLVTAVRNGATVGAMQFSEVELIGSTFLTPQTYTVNSLADTVDAQGCDATNCTLREAVAAANTNPGDDTINFSVTGTISLGTVGDNTFGPSALLVTSNITITGPSGDDGVTIARDAAAAPDRLRLFYVAPAGNLTLENLTLSGGRALGGSSDGGGGGAGLGGAIVNAGTLVLRRSTLANNAAQGGSGGAGFNGTEGGGGLGGDATGGTGGPPNGGAPGAAGGFGGGGGATGSEGSAGGFGGGGGSGGSSSVGSDGGFGGGSGNGSGAGGSPGYGGAQGFGSRGAGGGGAGFGGAVFNYGGSVTVVNSTIANNSALAPGEGFNSDPKGYGGGLFNLNGTVIFTNSTVAHNAASDGGGAVFNLGSGGEATQGGPALPVAQGSVTLNNTILSNSTNGEATPAAVSDYFSETTNGGSVASAGTSNIIQSNPNSGGFAGSHSEANPLLVGTSPADNGGPTDTFALQLTSPAIDQAEPATGVTTDQRGSPRPMDIGSTPNAGGGDGSDIGAFELVVADMEITKRDSQDPVGVGSSFTYTLRVYNRGPAEAHNVTVADNVPAGLAVTGVSLHASSDFTGTGCSFTGNSVNCALGTMRVFDNTHDGAVKKGKAIINVTVTASQLGQHTNEATVSADEADTFPNDNTGRQKTTVMGISSVEVTHDSVPGGSACQKPTLKVTLTGVAPFDTFVEVSDGLAATTNVPGSSAPLLLRIPQGQSSARLAIQTQGVAAEQSGQVAAAFGTSSASAPLTVRPVGLRSLFVSPSSLGGGGQSIGTVKLECAAGASGVEVTLKTGKPGVAKFISPSSGLSVHPLTLTLTNTDQATFTIQTFDVGAPTAVNVSATANGTTKNARLDVTPSP